MLERDIERQLCRIVKERGGLTYKFVSPNSPGVPDRIVITPDGAVFFVELKTLKGKLSPIQRWQISEMKKRKTNVRIVKGIEGVKEFVEEVLPFG